VGLQPENESVRCTGSCHCGRIKIEVQVPLRAQISKCNCSICAKSGHLHLTVAREELKLQEGGEELTEYRFNTGVARHLFCRVCGIKVFYVPRSHPDGYSVNPNCLELHEGINLVIRDFDGRHWERNIDQLLKNK